MPVTLLSLLLSGTLTAAVAHQATPPSIWSGVFSDAQAARGERAYQASCAACHGQQLVSVDSESPSLTGPRFKANWIGKTIAERYQRMRKSMPPGAPGSLDEQTDLDIVAFILQFNGYPSGDQELGLDTAVLEAIVIEKAPAAR
jgi:mono/diheme cytochrome c family protein